MHGIKRFSEKFVSPISQNEDQARREFIFNILLVAVIILSFITFVLDLIAPFMGWNPSVPKEMVFIILSFFAFLYFLSRKGFFIFTSIIFLGVFFFLNSYTAVKYGVDIPESLLVYALIIIMSGILVSTLFAFFAALMTAIFVLLVGYLQINSILPVQSYWRAELLNMANVVMIIVLFSIIATVSWLSNREIEKSLARARGSEAELKKERDSLEVKVEERTKELKETQAEKMTQLYRFAEFGRLSSGLFHDLINPLTAISLNIEKIKNTDASEHVNRAVTAARKMENMVNAVRKQLVREDKKTLFSLNTETKDAVAMLTHRARKLDVAVKFSEREDITFYGDAIKFNQIMMNLIANAIDSYMLKTGGRREALISSRNIDGMAEVIIKDYGAGITKENLPKIFDPFFTTKGHERGTGLGLSIVKRLVEKDFGGSIEVKSKENEGSVFTVKFPQKDNG